MKTFDSRSVRRAGVAAAAFGLAFSASAALTAKSYIIDGLIVQLDGKENVAYGQPYDSAATKWTDLTGNGSSVTLAGGAAFSSDCYGLGVQRKNCYMSFSNATKLFAAYKAASYTFEFAYDKTAATTVNAEGYANLRCVFFMCGNNAYKFGTWADNNIGACPNGTSSANFYGKTKSVTTTVGQHTYSVTQDGLAGNLYFDDLAASAYTVSALTESPSTAHGAHFNYDYYGTSGLDGYYHSVRLYDRPLTADEIAVNRAVDKVRYFGVDAATLTLPTGWRFVTTDGVRLERTASITVEPAGAGVVLGDDGETPQTSYWCEQNGTAQLTLTASPAEGYVFLGWQADGLSAEQKICPTLTANLGGNVIARFRKTDGSEPLDYTWIGGTDADWNDRMSWNDAGGVPGVPQANDSVTIPSGKTVTLTNTTPVYSSLTVAGTLSTINWTTCARADTVLIKKNGNVTVKSASTDAATNRVWIACSGLTIEAGGKIDVNTKGYQGKNGLGWAGLASKSGGGAHGGKASGGTCQTYGSITCPQDMGTGNYSPWSSSTGGGAVYLQVAGPAVINGTITANGGKDSYGNGNAAGGSVCLACETVSGSGTISANGGGGESNNAGVYGGGGGRIAVTYDAAKQAQVACDVAFSVRGGLERSSKTIDRYNRCGNCGTLYFTDDQFTQRPTLKLAGRVYYGPEVTPLAGLTGTSRTIEDSWLVIEPDGAEVNFTGDLTLSGSSAKINGIQLAGQHTRVTVGGTLSLSGAQLRLDGGDSVSVGGDVRLEDGKSYVNSGELSFRAAPTNSCEISARPLTIGGDFVLGNYGGYIPVCDPTNGAVVAATSKNFYMATNSDVNVDFCGYRLGKGKYTPSSYNVGSSHGGKGGACNENNIKNIRATYDNRKRPCEPGASSVYYAGESSDGGGVVIIRTGRARIDGTISASGGTSQNYSGAAAGGSVFLDVHRLMASQGSISANGGSEKYTGGSCRGCGGGGRIAIWYVSDGTDAAFKSRVVALGGRDASADELVQKWFNGQDGTVYWKRKGGMQVILR